MKLFLITFISYFLVVASLYSADPEVPVANQIQLLQKILSTEKQLLSANSKELVVGVVYQSDNKLSAVTWKDILAYTSNKVIKAGECVLKFVPIDISATSSIGSALNAVNKMDMLIITQLRAINFGNIKKFAIENSVLTYSTSAYVMENNKFSLSIGYKGNNVQPIINQQAVAAEGFNFPTSILKYAKVVR